VTSYATFYVHIATSFCLACPYSFVKVGVLLYRNVIVFENGAGLALLRFREMVERDPHGALSNWIEKDGDIDPCSWFGVECADGQVVIL